MEIAGRLMPPRLSISGPHGGNTEAVGVQAARLLSEKFKFGVTLSVDFFAAEMKGTLFPQVLNSFEGE